MPMKGEGTVGEKMVEITPPRGGCWMATLEKMGRGAGRFLSPGCQSLTFSIGAKNAQVG